MDGSLFNWCELFIKNLPGLKIYYWTLNSKWAADVVYVPQIWDCLFIPLTKALCLISPSKQALILGQLICLTLLGWAAVVCQITEQVPNSTWWHLVGTTFSQALAY